MINANIAIKNQIDKGKYQDALTGIRDIDAGMILLNQSFTLVTGVNRTKKTDYLLNIARYNAIHSKRVLFINLKNSVEYLEVKLLSISSRVQVRGILSKQMTEENGDSIIQSFSADVDNEILFYNSNEGHLQLKKYWMK